MQKLISKTAGFFANRHLGIIARLIIKKYSKHYEINLNEAMVTNIKEYKTFNAFFTRKLKTDARQIDQNTNILCSPADGRIMQVGPLSSGEWHIKGQHYPLKQLLANEELYARYTDGYSINIYLSPQDYHRVHMPYDGQLKQTIYIKGKLYSVDPNRRQSKFINKNERLICEFYNEKIGHFIIMFIGALIVGSIKTIWQDSSDKTHSKKTPEEEIIIKKGAEVGHFQLGSSVLLITEKQFTKAGNTFEDVKIKMGQPLLINDCNHV
jgi:phosphatidylserine decarboxylase